jgi:hypothetical protein
MFWFDQVHENEERRRIGQILISKMYPGLYLFIANDLWYNLENPPRAPRLTLAVVLHLFLSLQWGTSHDHLKLPQNESYLHNLITDIEECGH